MNGRNELSGALKALAAGAVFCAAMAAGAVGVSNLALGKPALLKNDRYLLWVLDGRDYFVDAGGGMRRTNPELVSLDNEPIAFPARKEPGTFRILCVGGSVTAGWPFHHTLSYPELLELRLRDLLPGEKIEVINAGFQATDSSRDAVIVRESMRWRPDLVIASEGRTDSWNHPLHVSRHAWMARLQAKLLRHVYAYGHLRKRFLDERFDEAMEVRGRMSRYAPSSREAAKGYFTRNLERIARAAERGGAETVFLTQVVHREEIGNDVAFMEAANRWIVRTARELDVPVIDVDRAFRESSVPRDGLLIPYGCVHPGPRGSLLMAETVCRGLAARGVIAPPEEWRWDRLRPDDEYLAEAGLTPEVSRKVFREWIAPLHRKLGLPEQLRREAADRYGAERL